MLIGTNKPKIYAPASPKKIFPNGKLTMKTAKTAKNNEFNRFEIKNSELKAPYKDIAIAIDKTYPSSKPLKPSIILKALTVPIRAKTMKINAKNS